MSVDNLLDVGIVCDDDDDGEPFTFSSGNSSGVSSFFGGFSVPPDPVPFRMNFVGVLRSVFLLKQNALTSKSLCGRVSCPPGRTLICLEFVASKHDPAT